jgi:putative salt-induced outer membrane protein
MKRNITLLALAMAPLSVAMAADDAEKKLWAGEANLAYIDSSGNTESTNFDFRSKATRDGEEWRNIYKLEGSNETGEQTDANGNEKEVRTAEKYFGSAKAEYKIGERSYLFSLAEYTDDRFSGFDYEASLTFGYGQDIFRTDKHELSADAGLGYRRTELESNGDVDEEAVLRLGAVYLWKISETASFDEDFSTEIGEEKTVTKSFTRIKVKINGSLNASLAYEIKHTSEVPDGTKNSDRKLLAGLNYTF